jgi:hypothetical protein
LANSCPLGGGCYIYGIFVWCSIWSAVEHYKELSTSGEH